MRKPRWSEQDKADFERMYTSSSIAEIMERFPNRSWEALKRRGHYRGLPLSRKNYNCDLTPLLDGSNESSYWLGFLLADGHFSRGAVVLELSQKDQHHIEKFCKFIGYPLTSVYSRTREVFGGHFPTVCVRATHKSVVDRLTTHFNISSKKTKTPPNLSSLSDPQLLCLLIGFIDGDGAICHRKDGSSLISLELDPSWLPMLTNFLLLLNRSGLTTESTAVLYTRKNTGKTFSRLQMSNHKFFTGLRQKIELLELPIMRRKWYPEIAS
jgi:hypothetical protein